jgi:hypothetical protein
MEGLRETHLLLTWCCHVFSRRSENTRGKERERHTLLIENISKETRNAVQKLERGIGGISGIVKVSVALSLSLSHEMISIGKLTITNNILT